MEKDSSLRRVGVQLAQDFCEEYNQNKRFGRAAEAIVGVWSAAVLVAGVMAVEEAEIQVAAANEISYEDPYTQDEVDSYLESVISNSKNTSSSTEPLPVETAPPSSEVTPIETTTTTIPPTTQAPTTTQAPPPPTTEQQLSVAEVAMAEMQLSVEGYENFLSSIDTSQLAFASQFREFNRDQLGADIPQRASEMFIGHFTAVYANDTPGFGHQPIGKFNVQNMISSMAGRYGHGGKCCGVQWMIGRDGEVFQTAPLDAKLNHALPHDSISTGVEIEAGNQDLVTTKQYEAFAYLAIAVLDTQGLLGTRPLDQILVGHGELREAWNAQNPSNTYAHKSDFPVSTMSSVRHYVDQFLQQNPQIIGRHSLANFSR